MQAIEILKNEHRVIEQVLDCLEALAERAGAAGRVDGAMAEQVLDFLRHFADRCHHGKEEDHLFPWLESRGFSREMGPTGVMLREHTLGRHYIGQMASTLASAARGEAGPLAQFRHAARAYVHLLREHIHKEDHCLFAMAEQAAHPEDDVALLAAYQKVEEQDIGAGVHEHYLALAQSLAERLGVAPRVLTPCAACCHS
jgi:hemerythrin-like domain-containing protein